MGMRADLRVDRRRSTVHRNLWARPASIIFVLHRTALREELEAACGAGKSLSYATRRTKNDLAKSSGR